MALIGDLLMRVLPEMAGFEAQLVKDAEKAGDKAGQQAGKSLGRRMSENTGKIFTAAGAAAGAIFTGAIGGAANFEDQLRTINTVANLTDEELSRVGKDILDLSKETGKSTDDLTAGFYDLVSAGVPAGEAVQVLRDSAVLATGALGTTAETVDLLTSAMNAYGLEASSSARISDIFAQAVADGKVTASELGSSLAQIAPIAAQAGVKLEEVAAGYAVLTAKGVPAAQAATQMRAAISALLTPNVQLNELQKQTGKNFAELARTEGLVRALDELRKATGGNDEAFAKALGSIEAYQFAVVTTGENSAEFATELDKVTAAADKGGVAQGQYEERMKSAASQGKKFVAGIRATALELAGPFVDSLGGAVIALNELGGGMGGLVNLSRLFGGALGGLSGAITAKVGPKLKSGLQKVLVKAFGGLIIPAAALAGPLEEGLSGGLDRMAKSSKVSAATSKLGNFLGSKLGKGLSVAFAAVAVFEVIETYNRISKELAAQSEQIGKDVGNQIVSGTTEQLRQSKAALEQGLKDINGVWDAGLFTTDNRKALEANLATVEAELARRADGIGRGVESSLGKQKDDVARGVSTMLSGANQGGDKAEQKGEMIGGRLVSGFYDGVIEKQSVVRTAIELATQTGEQTMSRAAETMYLIGVLTSDEMARGVNDARPNVAQAWKDAKKAALDRLEEIKPNAHTIGKQGAKLLADGAESTKPYIVNVSKRIAGIIEKNTKPNTKPVGRKAGQDVIDGLNSKKGPVGTAAHNLGRTIVRNMLGGILYQGGGRAAIDDVYVPRQHGGMAWPGMQVIGGERRPELFVPEVTGRIYPDIASGLHAAGVTGGGDTYQVTVASSPKAVESPADIMRQLRRFGEMGLLPRRRKTA